MVGSKAQAEGKPGPGPGSESGGVLRIAVPDANWHTPIDTGDLSKPFGVISVLRNLVDSMPPCSGLETPIELDLDLDLDLAVRKSYQQLFERDMRSLHCVQFTLPHLLGLVRSVFRSEPVVVEYTDNWGVFHSFREVYGEAADEGSSSLLERGYIQRSSFGVKSNSTRSIIVDVEKIINSNSVL